MEKEKIPNESLWAYGKPPTQQKKPGGPLAQGTRGEMVYLWAELLGLAEGLVKGGSEGGV